MGILSILGAIVGVVGKLAEPVTQSVSRHVCFLIHYKKNLKKLDAEMKDLEKQMGKFQEKVEAANHLGEDIEKDASDWLTDAEKMKEEVLEFLKNETAKENLRCCSKFSFPDYIWRYRLSKKANKKLGNVKNLNEKGKFSPVSHPRPPPEELQFQSSGDYMSFKSRERVFERIMEALKDSEVNMIGVCGPGGVGKTTMVQKVAKQAKSDGVFDEVVMAVVSTEANVIKIQGQLADHLNVTLRGETESGRAGQLWNRLNNWKKNLIILDDIWKEVNLKEIGIPITDENKGCKVVLTSRNRDVWKNMQPQCRDLPIKILSKPEAWALFKKKVGDSVDSDHELRPIAEAVCKECEGLPVAINAIGAALKDKEPYAWKYALKQMEKSMLNKIEGIDPNLYSSLALSYNLLQSDDAKSIFLLCCLLPEDFNISIESLMRHCMARRLLGENPDTLEEARLAVHTVVGTLKTSCLLLDGDDDVEHFVKMHDVVRDVAISILKSDGGEAFLVKDGVQEWPEKYSSEGYSAILLLNSNINYELPDELKCPKLHTLLFQSQYRHELLKVPDKFFSRMEKLTVLDFNDIRNLCG